MTLTRLLIDNPHLRALDGINPEDLAFADAVRGGVTTVAVAPGSAM